MGKQEGEPSRQDATLTELEQKLANLIYSKAPAGTTCPRCDVDIAPESCIADPSIKGWDTIEWKNLAVEIIKVVKEDTNENQQGE